MGGLLSAFLPQGFSAARQSGVEVAPSGSASRGLGRVASPCLGGYSVGRVEPNNRLNRELPSRGSSEICGPRWPFAALIAGVPPNIEEDGLYGALG